MIKMLDYNYSHINYFKFCYDDVSVITRLTNSLGDLLTLIKEDDSVLLYEG